MRFDVLDVFSFLTFSRCLVKKGGVIFIIVTACEGVRYATAF